MKKVSLILAVIAICSISLVSCTKTSINDEINEGQKTSIIDDGEITDDDI